MLMCGTRWWNITSSSYTVSCICRKIAFELSCFVHFIWETVLIPMVMGSSSGINLGLHRIGILFMIWYFTQNTVFLKLPVFGGVHLEPFHWLRIVLFVGIIYPSEPPILAQVLTCICWGSWNLKQRYLCLSLGVTPDGSLSLEVLAYP